MFLSRVPWPEAPAYCVHQHLWGYFDLPAGAPRPFVFRRTGEEALMLSRIRPSCSHADLLPRIEAGRAYQFELLASPVNGRKKRDDTGRRKSCEIRDNEQLRAWCQRRLEGAELRFCQSFRLETLRFRKAGGADVVVPMHKFLGMLYVEDLSLFRETLLQGAGKGKAWGCGMIYLPEVMQ